jgi:hypothetical protein
MSIFDAIGNEIKRVQELKSNFNYTDRRYLKATELELYLINIMGDIMDNYGVQLLELENEASTKQKIRKAFTKKKREEDE